MGKERSAGLLIFRRFNSQIEYLLLKASEMGQNWTPPKGTFNFKIKFEFKSFLESKIFV